MGVQRATEFAIGRLGRDALAAVAKFGLQEAVRPVFGTRQTQILAE